MISCPLPNNGARPDAAAGSTGAPTSCLRCCLGVKSLSGTSKWRMANIEERAKHAKREGHDKEGCAVRFRNLKAAKPSEFRDTELAGVSMHCGPAKKPGIHTQLFGSVQCWCVPAAESGEPSARLGR